MQKARYVFVLNTTKPFEEAYPRSFFEDRVRQMERKERALERAFGVKVTPTQLAQEYDRIEKATRAPEQWQAIQAALGRDRRLVEEIVCRPLLVERLLRQKFDLDRTVHAAPHQKARELRAEFAAGRTPRGVVTRVLEARGQAASLDDMLTKAMSPAEQPHTPGPGTEPGVEAPLPISPELQSVLDRELKRPGDVTTILEDREAFQVMRLIARRKARFTVEVVAVPKRSFDEWLNEVGT